MRRHLPDLLVLVGGCSVGAFAAALAAPGWRGVTIRAYVFALGAIAMLALIAAAGEALPRRRPSALDAALDAVPPPDPPLPQLERTMREVTLAQARAFDLHRTLLPQLREIAAARLASTGRSAGPGTLGRWWELLRPDAEPPADRFAAGIPAAELRALVHDLQRLGAVEDRS